MLQNIQYTYITERRTQDISGKRIAIACEDLHSFPIIFIEMGKGYLRQEDGFYHVFLFFFNVESCKIYFPYDTGENVVVDISFEISGVTMVVPRVQTKPSFNFRCKRFCCWGTYLQDFQKSNIFWGGIHL